MAETFCDAHLSFVKGETGEVRLTMRLQQAHDIWRNSPAGTAGCV